MDDNELENFLFTEVYPLAPSDQFFKNVTERLSGKSESDVDLSNAMRICMDCRHVQEVIIKREDSWNTTYAEEPPQFGQIDGVEGGMLWKYCRRTCGEHPPKVLLVHISAAEEASISSLIPSGAQTADDLSQVGDVGNIDFQSGSAETPTEVDKEARLYKTFGVLGGDWTQGNVHVFCSSSKKEHPATSSVKGVKYDGLYKIIKIWQGAGNLGNSEWNYILRRDDTPVTYAVFRRNKIKKGDFFRERKRRASKPKRKNIG